MHSKWRYKQRAVQQMLLSSEDRWFQRTCHPEQEIVFTPAIFEWTVHFQRYHLTHKSWPCFPKDFKFFCSNFYYRNFNCRKKMKSNFLFSFLNLIPLLCWRRNIRNQYFCSLNIMNFPL